MLTGADRIITGSLQLAAVANINIFFASASTVAFIDPHLEINAAFLTANPGATLTITPGVGNVTSAVLEPSTYALLLAGLASISVVVRRRALVL